MFCSPSHEHFHSSRFHCRHAPERWQDHHLARAHSSAAGIFSARWLHQAGGQRFVQIEEQKIDEDSVLMDSVYQLNCPLVDMSPIAVEPDFTRKYLQAANNEALVKKIQKAFDRVAWEKDFVLCEGSGHAGVGSVFDLSNAQVAKILGAK